MNRLVGVAVVSVWLASVAALVAHDLWPRWAAQEPPAVVLGGRDVQVGIFDSLGRRVGSAWTSVAPSPGSTGIRSTTVLEHVRLLPPVRIESSLVYVKDELDQVQMRVYGAGPVIALRGENMGGGFPCELTVGPIRRTFAFDARTMQAMGEAFRPFDVLSDLRVGQSWRVHLFDPLKQILGKQADFASVVVRVTGKEVIQHGGGSVECFRVEAPSVVAYVDSSGQVLEQRVQLPVIGTIVLRDEPLDRAAREQARQRIGPSEALGG
jgi:hypothetical protein